MAFLRAQSIASATTTLCVMMMPIERVETEGTGRGNRKECRKYLSRGRGAHRCSHKFMEGRQTK